MAEPRAGLPSASGAPRVPDRSMSEAMGVNEGGERTGEGSSQVVQGVEDLRAGGVSSGRAIKYEADPVFRKPWPTGQPFVSPMAAGATRSSASLSRSDVVQEDSVWKRLDAISREREESEVQTALLLE